MDEETETSPSCLVSPLHSCIAQINLSVCFGDITAPACASARCLQERRLSSVKLLIMLFALGLSYEACVTQTGIHILFIYFLGARLMLLSVSMSFVWTCAVNHLQVRDTAFHIGMMLFFCIFREPCSIKSSRTFAICSVTP